MVRKMSDVWRELEEKLKQKARWIISFPFKNTPPEEWVRLEDVLSILQQLRENYVLVSKDWLKSYCDRCGQKKDIADVWKQIFKEEPPEELLNCPDCGIDRFIEELLRKNEG